MERIFTNNYRNDIILRDYFDLICKFLSKIVDKIGDRNIYFNISKVEEKDISICVQCEHTLVIGNETDEYKYGSVYSETDRFLIRIDKYNCLKEYDYVIEYSIPNIINISTNDFYKEFYNKIIYIPPLIYDYFVDEHNREINVLTTFMTTFQPRRNKLIEMLNEEKIDYNNISGKNGEELKHILRNTKILINIHQSELHQTVEEFRILPALRCGVIVISEKSPFYEKIAYKDFIIWCDYEDIINTVKNVMSNYDEIFKEFFMNDKLSNVFKDMENNVSRKLSDIFSN